MPTIGEVNTAFIKDKIAKTVSRFYDNIIESKKTYHQNYYGSVDFCQFVKYADINTKIIKRGYDETNLKKTIISGMFAEYKIELTEIKEVPGWILSTIGGYSMRLIIDRILVIDYTVDQYDYPVRIETYIKGSWIDMILKENNIYQKDINGIFLKMSRADDPADPDKFKI
jgi:hypothetical protein